MTDIIRTESAKHIAKLPPQNLEEAGLVPTIRKPLGAKMFFSEQRVSSLVLEYRKTGNIETWHKIILESMNLIDGLILDPKYRFDRFDCLDALRNECVIKLTYCIGKWDPARGRCYSLFSQSIQNFLFSYADRAKRYRDFMAQADNDRLDNSPDPKAAPVSINFRERMEMIEVRFWQVNHLEALSFLVQHFFENGETGDKRVILRVLVMRYGLTSRQAELLYCYSLLKVRASLFEFYGPHDITDMEILRSDHQWSLLPELAEIAGDDIFNRMLTLFSGMTLTFPTAEQIRRMHGLREWMSGLSDVSQPAIDKSLEYGSAVLQTLLDAHRNGAGYNRRLPLRVGINLDEPGR